MRGSNADFIGSVRRLACGQSLRGLCGWLRINKYDSGVDIVTGYFKLGRQESNLQLPE
jgi:hypothetical protein